MLTEVERNIIIKIEIFLIIEGLGIYIFITPSKLY